MISKPFKPDFGPFKPTLSRQSVRAHCIADVSSQPTFSLSLVLDSNNTPCFRRVFYNFKIYIRSHNIIITSFFSSWQVMDCNGTMRWLLMILSIKNGPVLSKSFGVFFCVMIHSIKSHIQNCFRSICHTFPNFCTIKLSTVVQNFLIVEPAVEAFYQIKTESTFTQNTIENGSYCE